MTRKIFLNASLAFLLVLGLSASAWAVTATDKAVETALQQELGKKYKDVRVTVDDRVATLNGAVDSYLDKLSVAKTAKRYSALHKVVNNVTVAGPTVSDQELYEHLAKQLSGDRTFNGNVFDSFYLLVKDGTVTISGYAHNYLSHDSAVGIVESEKGVKNVVDKMEILPLSRFDDGIRLAAARTIYGRPGMEMYALDPAHPIRIIVNNGNVILDGEVLNKMDKELAEMGALQVSGVFSVTNNLRVGSDSRDSRTAD
jgi:hyperosmotically inducible protein